MAQPSISNPIKIQVNKSIESSIFSKNLKAAQVSPLFKKNNSLDKGNYRPVSVLPCISKIYERAIHDQLMDYSIALSWILEMHGNTLTGL